MYTSIRPGQVWLDTAGKRIQAHGGSILYENGVYVNSSLPPAAAPHECLLRTSLMATHTHALIEEAVDTIAEVLRRYDL